MLNIKKFINKVKKWSRSHPDRVISELQKVWYQPKRTSMPDTLMKSAKDDYTASLANHPKKQEVIDFATKLPNRNWGDWVVRNEKQNPGSMTPEHKTAIEHFSGMTHLPKVAAVRFDKTHDFNKGIEHLQTAEKASQDSNTNRYVNPKGEKLLDLGNGLAWWDLKTGGCDEEGSSMQHCGNVPSKKAGDTLLSLRQEKPGGKHDPLVTVVRNKGFIGETKGRQNTKPSPKYHKAIAELLKHKSTKGLVGGGYLPEANFHLDEIAPELKQDVLKTKRDIEHPYIEDLPERFKGDYNLPPTVRKGKPAGKISKLAMIKKINQSAPDSPELKHLALKPHLPLEIQKLLAEKNDEFLNEALAENETTHPDTLHQLSEKTLQDREVPSGAEAPFSDLELLLARNKSTSPTTLNRILKTRHPNHPLVGALTRHRNLSPEDQKYLFDSSRPNSDRHANLATRLDLHPDVQMSLATTSEPGSEIQAQLARRDKTHPDVLHLLAQADAEHTHLHGWLGTSKNLRPDTQMLLAQKTPRYSSTHSVLLSNPNLAPEVQKYFADLYPPDTTPYQNLSVHPQLHPEVQKILAERTSPDALTQIGLANNPNIHPDVQRYLSSVNPVQQNHVHARLARNSATLPEIQQRIVREDNGYLEDHLVENPNLDPEVQKHLLGIYEPASNMHKYLADHPNLHPDLHDKLPRHPYPVAKLNLMPDHQLVKLTNVDENSSDAQKDAARKAYKALERRREQRLEQDLGPTSTPEKLKLLAQSHDDEVAEKAKAELKRREPK